MPELQADLSCQTSLRAGQSMRTFSFQTKSIEQFDKDQLDQLTQMSQPLPPLFGPFALAGLIR
ncbi:hypothetical protein [Ktedonobacter sp. SOSP1-52]|uniref:hypothetical protein n=1 Tax=Ktedonobacter sp. SOSP1-52 TaxID=2778366 RepID=UPI0019150180|nr:hypothetical protein [Ktedonobacter sp. SOSP1-52]